MTLYERILEHLKQKGTYDPGVDDEMAQDLYDNTLLAKKIFKQLVKEGPIIEYQTTSGSPMTKINPLMNCYQMQMRNVYQLASKLGINRADRLKLKIIETKNNVMFDQLMDE